MESLHWEKQTISRALKTDGSICVFQRLFSNVFNRTSGMDVPRSFFFTLIGLILCCVGASQGISWGGPRRIYYCHRRTVDSYKDLSGKINDHRYYHPKHPSFRFRYRITLFTNASGFTKCFCYCWYDFYWYYFNILTDSQIG